MNTDVTVLLVDDLEENLLALEALLRGSGLRILKARSGDEALEHLLVNDVALALVDVQMPDMDGFALAELMRGMERTKHVPIMFVTAGSRDRERMFQGYDSGAVDFLYKPIEPHVLKNKVAVFVELHRQRVALAKELETRSETLRFQETFMAILGHDLRTPLSAILMTGHALQRSPDEIAKRSAARILSSGERMERMIRDLLDLARARLGGGIPLQKGEHDAKALVERAVQEVRAARPDATVELTMKGNAVGRWDPDRIGQVLANLLMNAATHGGGTVQVTCDGDFPSHVRIAIANPGVIPDDVQRHMFDPFHGRSSAGDASAGLGLGLYIVERIVVGHGGTIDVRSSAEHGTTVTVVLPRDA